jgi:VanZ family protein
MTVKASSNVSQSIRRKAWPLVFAALIFIASERPAPSGPDVAGTDKAVHFVVYGVLATMTCRLGNGWPAAARAVLATACFGALDEWHQSFVPARSAEFADWIADTLGAIVAVILYTAWPRYRRWLELPIRFRRAKKIVVVASVTATPS